MIYEQLFLSYTKKKQNRICQKLALLRSESKIARIKVHTNCRYYFDYNLLEG